MDTIKLYGIEFYAYHGVLQSEKELGQVFKVDCEFSFDSSICNDDISKTINYGQVALDIKDYATKNRFDLLESLANGLADEIMMSYALIESVTITIHKPYAPITSKFDDVTMTVTRNRVTAYLAIGSNLGDRKANLDSVIERVNEDSKITLISRSTYIETEPYGVLDQPRFLNGVIKVSTIYTPRQLLYFCKECEQAAGRIRTRRWGERTLDVDIIIYGQEKIFSDDLIIPHPEMHLRDFVLRPLEEIEPYLIHPLKGVSVRELLEGLDE